MKKALCLLTAMMLLLCACGSALAETGYLFLKDDIAELLETEPIEVPYFLDIGDQELSIDVDLTRGRVSLTGRDEQDEPKSTLWDTDDTVLLYAVYITYCSMYDEITAMLDDGWWLSLSIRIDDDTFGIIDSSEMAALFIEAVQGL